MDVIVKHRVLDGIPLYDFEPINPPFQRLVIFQHGYTMNKEDGAWAQCMHFATRGFRTIALDAYGHGERYTKPLQYDDYQREMVYFYELIEQTALDIKTVYESHYKIDYPTYNIAGESMGGMLTFMVGCIMDGLAGIASIVGSPSLIEYGYQDMLDHDCNESDIKGMLDHLKDYDAMEHLERFRRIPIYMINGLRDHVVPKKYAESFKQKIEELYDDTLITYVTVDCDHWVPHKYLIPMYDWASTHFG